MIRQFFFLLIHDVLNRHFAGGNNTSEQVICLIGASLSEPHIDETNARNPYIITSVKTIE